MTEEDAKRLAQIKAREQATPVGRERSLWAMAHHYALGAGERSQMADAAETIAHARAGLAWLIERVEAQDAAIHRVLDEHSVTTEHYSRFEGGYIIECSTCEERVPCATVRAIEGSAKND